MCSAMYCCQCCGWAAELSWFCKPYGWLSLAYFVRVLLEPPEEFAADMQRGGWEVQQGSKGFDIFR
jgi:hypothetical protein